MARQRVQLTQSNFRTIVRIVGVTIDQKCLDVANNCMLISFLLTVIPSTGPCKPSLTADIPMTQQLQLFHAII